MEDLGALAAYHLRQAHLADHGRSAHLFLHDGPLRQSVIALTAGTELGEHEAPPASSLQVLSGLVRLTTADGDAELTEGQLTVLPHVRQGLQALHDSAVLLTAVTATSG